MNALNSRKFGVEIEMSAVDISALIQELKVVGVTCKSENYNHQTRRHWKIVSDSSIYSDDYSRDKGELVSPVLKGQAGMEELELVLSVLNYQSVRCNESCGLHVHHDAADLQLPDFKHLYLRYLKYEGCIDAFMPSYRRRSIDCVASLRRVVTGDYDLDPATFEKCIKDVMKAKTLHDVDSIMTNQSRYVKLNMRSYWQHGTVEFRHHHGTTETEQVLNWVRFGQYLIENAQAHYLVTPKGVDERKGLFWRDSPSCSSARTSLMEHFFARQKRYA